MLLAFANNNAEYIGDEVVILSESGAEIFGIPGAKLIPCLQKDLAMAAPRAPDVTLDCSKAYALGFSPQTLREEITRLASCIKVK